MIFKGDHPQHVCPDCGQQIFAGVVGCPDCAEMSGAGVVEAPAPDEYWPNFYTEALGMDWNRSQMEECPGCGDLFTTLEIIPGMFVGQCGVCRADVTFA